MRIQELWETHASRSRRQPLTAAQVVEMLPDYMNAWQKYLAGDVIYRGVKSDLPDGRSYVDPKLTERKSANTSNLYTLFVDSDPRWHDYPDRSRSLICTNTWRVAKSYGHAHVVLWANHSQIGICKRSDWWNSFPYLMAQLKNYNNTAIYDMSDVNRILEDAYRAVFHEGIRINQAHMLREDLNKLGEYVRQHDLHELAQQGRRDQYVFEQSGLFELFLSQEASLSDLLGKLLDPEANGFKLTSVENYIQAENENELWGDGAAIMLDLAAVEELKINLGVT